jgi:chemotaxis response regulator CheB
LVLLFFFLGVDTFQGKQESNMNRAIRVLVANQPRLMRELIMSTLTDQPDMEIVGEVADDSEIPGEVAKSLPDLVVISLDESGKRPVLCDTILQKHPEVRIIAVAFQKNRSVFYWATFDIHSSEIESSEQGILNAARGILDRARGSERAN